MAIASLPSFACTCMAPSDANFGEFIIDVGSGTASMTVILRDDEELELLHGRVQSQTALLRQRLLDVEVVSPAFQLCFYSRCGEEACMDEEAGALVLRLYTSTSGYGINSHTTVRAAWDTRRVLDTMLSLDLLLRANKALGAAQ